ncbi:anthranilate synthase component I family protein [Amycolatopsis sp. 195334CR]|uniref:anthranilate synthase component I family protein n=1 Tax=Amycolatopsis sp. 195334CR TaxID=2814588 RepID=UPI001A8C76A3|nr:chorismate-binding protein [Amycolatopsis sp. 195334CR]MBN6039782.1 chorismate-binding protein [Amycolatopsis sp. 195334CR]
MTTDLAEQVLAADHRSTPDRTTTAALARDHEIVPVYQEFLADLVTPVTAFTQLCGPDEPGFLLESVPVSGGVARYSYLGYRPRPLELPAGDPLDALAALLDRSVAPVRGLPPFHGGAMGYLGYETARHFERLPVSAGAPPGLPESAFLSCDDLVVFDHATRRVLLITAHRPREESYDAATGRLAEIRERLLTPVPPAPFTTSPEPPADVLAGWRSNFTQAEFEARVERAKEYIAAGDAFQIVLSQRFSKPLEASPLDLYRQLRATNPSPYMYHLSLGGGRHIVGASPELLVRADGRRVQTRPLAGTRPRGTDAADDLALELELLADEKERAEHVMLVDLGRHDLGRVTVPGTVTVDELMRIERFSHVMHISSTVSGELSPGRTGLDALRSTFPAGTLSGAPKIRAMEIIAELEDERRGVYGGAIGTVGFGGAADLAIALRTMVIADGQVHVQAGAGVVADSDPTAEYRETCHKARAMLTAVHAAEARP